MGVGAPGCAADLGSGGGVPGLILALRWPESAWTLVDARVRRCEFLREAVHHLGLEARVHVVEARAEALGKDPAHRGTYDLVVARGFAPPAVTAECAAPLLAVGGRAVISDPPAGGEQRWPQEALAILGLVSENPQASAAPYHYQYLRQAVPCPARFPRRPGIPAKRPLF